MCLKWLTLYLEMFIYKLPVRSEIANVHIDCGQCERMEPEVVFTGQTWSLALQGSMRSSSYTYLRL